MTITPSFHDHNAVVVSFDRYILIIVLTFFLKMYNTTPQLKTGYALPHDHNVGAVIVGFDRFINYYKIQYAQLCINENPVYMYIFIN